MTLLAGHISDEEAELSEPTLGIEFDPEYNESNAVVYIDEGAGATEVHLSYKQVGQFRDMVGAVYSEMQWHKAEWVSASETASLSTDHLMKKGEHDPNGKTLCGRLPSSFGRIIGGWKLHPILGEPSRRRRNKFSGGTCQRCLAIYDKRLAGSPVVASWPPDSQQRKYE